MIDTSLTRQQLLTVLADGTVAVLAWPRHVPAAPTNLVTKRIPSSSEPLLVNGMGTWRTFNVGDDPVLRNARIRVLWAFFAGGWPSHRLIAYVPSSQEVVGYSLERLNRFERAFSADGEATREQIGVSAGKWRTKRFNLMQVHNLLAWKSHFPMLRDLGNRPASQRFGSPVEAGCRTL